MTKIVFIGAGSTVFVRNILGDCMQLPSLQDAEVALYDIDGVRLKESLEILENLNGSINGGRMRFVCFCGEASRREALSGADFVINAANIGGYEPATVVDFEVPKKYGLRQTIADTMGIGGIFRAQRSIPFLLDVAREMEAVCPEAWLLNYANPMAMLTGAVLKATSVRAIGLCHSVQVCVASLLNTLGMYSFRVDFDKKHKLPMDYGWKEKVAGINHMAWLLEVTKDGKDMYPELHAKAAEYLRENVGHVQPRSDGEDANLVRLQLMQDFGYYVTESSVHNAEYTPFWIKAAYPDVVSDYGITLDEYPKRCVRQREQWAQEYKAIREKSLTHVHSIEYASEIMEAMVSCRSFSFGGNLPNNGYIENLPSEAIVEVPCIADGDGIRGTVVGRLPMQCAALNMTNINVQLLSIEAALTRSRQSLYQAAMLDPHTAGELPIDRIKALCDDMIAAHGDLLPNYS